MKPTYNPTRLVQAALQTPHLHSTKRIRRTYVNFVTEKMLNDYRYRGFDRLEMVRRMFNDPGITEIESVIRQPVTLDYTVTYYRD